MHDIVNSSTKNRTSETWQTVIYGNFSKFYFRLWPYFNKEENVSVGPTVGESLWSEVRIDATSVRVKASEEVTRYRVCDLLPLQKKVTKVVERAAGLATAVICPKDTSPSRPPLCHLNGCSVLQEILFPENSADFPEGKSALQKKKSNDEITGNIHSHTES